MMFFFSVPALIQIAIIAFFFGNICLLRVTRRHSILEMRTPANTVHHTVCG